MLHPSHHLFTFSLLTIASPSSSSFCLSYSEVAMMFCKDLSFFSSPSTWMQCFWFEVGKTKKRAGVSELMRGSKKGNHVAAVRPNAGWDPVLSSPPDIHTCTKFFTTSTAARSPLLERIFRARCRTNAQAKDRKEHYIPHPHTYL